MHVDFFYAKLNAYRNGLENEVAYVRCLFVRMRRDDAIAAQMADGADDPVQWQQSSDRLRRRHAGGHKRKRVEL